MKCKIEGCGKLIARENIKAHQLNKCKDAIIDCEICESAIYDDNH